MGFSIKIESVPRATATDWVKAFLCSAALVGALLLVLWNSPGSREEETISVGSSARSESGSGGEGRAGIGPGKGSGRGAEGAGPGAGKSGADRSAEATEVARTGPGSESSPPVESSAPNSVPVVSTASATEPVNPPNEPPASREPEPASPETPPALPTEVPKFALLSPAAPSANAPTLRSPAASGVSGQSGGAPVGKNVGGMFVKGSSLGVILDVSGSMTEFLPALRAEIRSQFPDAVFLEVNGCSLSAGEGGGLEPTPGLRVGAERASTMAAIRELVKQNGVDSVYWFCDLKDFRDGDAIHELGELVAGTLVDPSGGEFSGLDELKRMQQNRSRSNKNAVFHLYVRSVGLSPDAPLQRVIDESGGAFELHSEAGNR